MRLSTFSALRRDLEQALPQLLAESGFVGIWAWIWPGVAEVWKYNLKVRHRSSAPFFNSLLPRLIVTVWINSCGATFIHKNCNWGYADMQFRSNISLKKLQTWIAACEKKLWLRICGYAIAEQHVIIKLQIYCRKSPFLKLGNCDWRFKNSCGCPPLQKIHEMK